MPAYGAGRLRAYLASGGSGGSAGFRDGTDPFGERRRLRIETRPARASA
jgi:hypothetical protein